MTLNNDVSINFGSYVFSYNEEALRTELSKTLAPDRVEEILKEIQEGDLSSIRELGLSHLVTISNPGLEEPAPMDYSAFLESFDEKEIFSLVDAMIALFQAAQKYREAVREGRHAEAESAMNEALAAADKIRSSAMFSLVFGVVSGAINIGMGMFSAISSAKQLGTMKSASTEFKSANIENKQVKNDLKLSESQKQLKQVKSDIEAGEAKVKALETRAKAEADADTAKSNMDSLSKEKTGKDFDQKAYDKAKADYEAKQKAVDDLKDKDVLGDRTGGKVTQEEIDAAKNTLAENKKTAGDLETEINGLADKAKKSNEAHDKQLESEIKKLEGEYAKATESGDTKKAESLRQEISVLEEKRSDLATLRQAYDNPTSDAALNSAGDRYNTLSNRVNDDGNTPRYSAAKTELDRVANALGLQTAKLQGISSAGGGVAQILQSVGNFLAEGERADGAEHTAEQQAASARMDDMIDQFKASGETMKSAMDLLKAFFQSLTQVNSSIYQNI